MVKYTPYLVLLVLMSCATSKPIATPITEPQSYLTMDNTQVIYRGYDSVFEYGTNCPSCCESYIIAEGGTVRELDSTYSTNYTAIFKPDSISDKAILNLYCICYGDTNLVLTKEYPIIQVPHPAIYYSGVNLTDYTLYNDTVTFGWGGIRPDFSAVPGIGQSSAFIHKCSYTYKNKDYTLSGPRNTFPASIWNEIKLGEVIKFNSVVMRYADGRLVTLHLNREIIKASSIESNVFILK
jgi:hypothetical protein